MRAMPMDKKGPIVLLVEDSEDDAYFFRRAFEKSGANCLLCHVTNGAEAIGFLEHARTSEPQNLPFVIFLDLKMPIVNGFEFLEWMKTFSSSIQVIVLSGSDYPEDKDRAERLGAIDYLVKPVRAESLRRYLLEVCPPEMGARV
jgi:CheY-like chemotaxis protein